MSLVGARDGSQCDYADVADALVDWHRVALPQLESLLARAALNIALQNAYEQLRNLGFLRRGGSWVLSPVSDVNINPYPGKQRVTSVFGEMCRSEIDGQRELAEELYVSRTAVSKWESGRGYPSIDSLREVSRSFSVTIDSS